MMAGKAAARARGATMAAANAVMVMAVGRAMRQVDERWQCNKRRRRRSERWCNNQLTGQTRGKQEAEVLADKRQQCDKRSSVDNARLVGSGQHQQE